MQKKLRRVSILCYLFSMLGPLRICAQDVLKPNSDWFNILFVSFSEFSWGSSLISSSQQSWEVNKICFLTPPPYQLSISRSSSLFYVALHWQFWPVTCHCETTQSELTSEQTEIKSVWLSALFQNFLSVCPLSIGSALYKRFEELQWDQRYVSFNSNFLDVQQTCIEQN